jgi:tetratricopeptide (TPR) repeat protein
MEGIRILDSARGSTNQFVRFAWITLTYALTIAWEPILMRAFCAMVVLLCFASGTSAQTVPAQSSFEQQARTLAAAQRWAEIVRLLGPIQPRTAEMDFSYGMALARLGRWTEAESALQAGQKLAPADARFPEELAGIAFEQKNNPLAARRMRQALRLKPNDAYANDFLGTVFFLEDNLEASLKYWNRVGKPQIIQVRQDPVPRVDPALLDQAFAFSPAATLRLPQLLDTKARLRGLGIFPRYQFDLRARNNGQFDMVFRNQERNGFGDGKLEALFLSLRGLPFQSVNPEYDNFHRDAINFASLLRWDAQKRRIFVQASGPFEHGAKYRWDLTADLRGENWALRNGFAGPAPVLASFNLRSEVASFQLVSYASGRLGWSVGAEVSHRNFRSVAPGTILTPQMLAPGYQLKPEAQLTATLWRVPERRFILSAGAGAEAARLWSPNPQTFEKLTGSLGWHWFPRAVGDDYETSQQLRAGKTFGQPPFDELFILGLERDNNLPMHAHIGTRDGLKGSAPLGRDYFLQNWQLDKNLYSNGIVRLQLGPLLDIGRIADPGTQLGSHQWLYDTGAQAKLRIFGTGLVFSYGKDLRTGNNAFYLMLLQ